MINQYIYSPVLILIIVIFIRVIDVMRHFLLIIEFSESNKLFIINNQLNIVIKIFVVELKKRAQPICAMRKYYACVTG